MDVLLESDKSFLGMPLGALVFARAEEIRYVHQTETAPGVKTRFSGHEPDTRHAWGNRWRLRTALWVVSRYDRQRSLANQ